MIKKATDFIPHSPHGYKKFHHVDFLGDLFIILISLKIEHGKLCSNNYQEMQPKKNLFESMTVVGIVDAYKHKTQICVKASTS